MGASTTTPNINLPQFGDNDRPTWRGDINGAFNDIDGAHEGLSARVTDVETRATDLESRTTDDFLNSTVAAWSRDTFASKFLDGAASDLVALQDARDDAVARGVRLVVDDIGREWVIESALTFDTLTNFSFHMEGRIKRADASANRVSLIHILNCNGFNAGTIRTDGNAATNGFGGIGVDEAKHCIRIDGSTNVKIDRTESRNPAGDGVYVVGDSDDIWIGHCESESDVANGRNTLSVVQGSNIVVNSVVCRGTGYSTMPGGVDIEPNDGQTVANVTIGTVSVETAGTGGFTVVGAFPAAGVRQIDHVTVGEVRVVKSTGVLAASTDTIVRGVNDCVITSLTVYQDAAATNVALAIDDCDDVRILDVDIPRAGKPTSIGIFGIVTNLYMRGKLTSASSHGLSITALSNAVIDMKLRCLAVGGLLVVKQPTGVSSNVRFRGDWRKDGTAGTGVMQINGPVTDWFMENVDATGWTNNRLVCATPANGASIKRINCRGINNATAIPGNTGDLWNAGDILWNDTPVAAGPPGWVCVTSGNYGTFVFKAMASLAA